MTLQQLHYALELRRYGGFKQAASHLGISQPALSIQIQKLEDEFGMVLFDRSSSPIAPTPDGEAFLIRAQELVTGAQSLRQFAGDLRGDISGKLHVGIIPTLAPFLVPLFVDSLQQAHPALKLDFSEMLTHDVITGVRAGDLDAGLISTPVNVYGIQSAPLFYERFFFYSCGDIDVNKLRLETIDYHQLWLLNEGNCFRDQINDFCDLKAIRKGRNINYRSNSIDALIRMVDTKGGITILPELTTLTLNAEQESYITPIANKAREIGMITRPLSARQRLIQKLGESIRANIPTSMLSPDGLEVVDPGIVTA
jgi:LysR family transcriptional regulator, hydrogen peroxide-inducible genes activator